MNFIDGLFLYESRKRKLAKLKLEHLPSFPRSLVRTRCLHVLKRP